MRSIKQLLIIIILSAIFAAGDYLITKPEMPDWSIIQKSAKDSAFVPESAYPDDPPFITLNEALVKYQTPGVLFIDARAPEDYEMAHITGAINIPYDYIDQSYWTDVPPELNNYDTFVVYCSGTECELSLLLGRDMIYQGYENVYIFFGGWSEWEEADLDVVRRK